MSLIRSAWMIPLIPVVIAVGCQAQVSPASIEQAVELYDHGLTEDATRLMIAVRYDPDSDARAQALYYLGQMSFESGRYAQALKDWTSLVSDYPESERAEELKERLKLLSEVMVRVTDVNIDSATAQAYLKNGDFWNNSSSTFTIDSSWLPQVELAFEWYDRVISEWPGTRAS